MKIELSSRDIAIIVNVLNNNRTFVVKGCGDWGPDIQRIEEELVKQHNEQIKRGDQ